MARHHRIRAGDLVIAERAAFFTEYNGCLALVISGLARRRMVDLGTMERSVGLCYRLRILMPGELVVLAEPHQVRRLDEGEPQASSKSRKGRTPRRVRTLA